MLLSTDVSQCGEAARLVIVMFFDVAGSIEIRGIPGQEVVL